MGEIEDLKSIYIEYLSKQAAKRNEKHSIDQQLKQLMLKKEKHRDSKQKLFSSRKALFESHKEATKTLEKLEQDFRSKQVKLEKLKRDLEDKRINYQKSQTKLYQGYQYIEKMKSRKEMLEEMKEDFQGYFQGVKKVLKAREKNLLYEIHGAVLELVDIPKKFITAIETVLGGQAQHIVVSNEEAARSAIGYLKKTKAGRATFLPLTSITERYIPENIQQKISRHQGFIGIASQLVKADTKYEKVIRHLMGHVIIAKTLKDANEIARLANRRYRVVTLEGDVVNPGGSMSGGTRKQQNSSLFTREKDLQEVTEKLRDFTQKADSFSQDVREQKATIKKYESQVEDLENDIQQEQQNLQQKRENVTQINMRLESLNENLELYNREQRQFNQEEANFKDMFNELTNNMDEIKQELQSVQKKIDILTAEENEMKENREKYQDELHGHQVALAEQMERLKHQQEKTSSLKQNLTDSEKQYKKYTAELDNLLEVEKLDESEEMIEQKIEYYRDSKEKMLANIQQKRSERNIRTQKVNDHEMELKEESRQHQMFAQKNQEKEVKANRMDVDLENRLSQLQEDYEITYESARKTYEKCKDKDEAKEAVKLLKNKINDLGTVNIGAIDEYERISERYSFLMEQKEDL